MLIFLVRKSCLTINFSKDQRLVPNEDLFPTQVPLTIRCCEPPLTPPEVFPRRNLSCGLSVSAHIDTGSI